MKTTILLPHYKTREMTAFTVKQILACRGRHEANIIVIDNGGGEGLDLIPNDPAVSILPYPNDLLQSHGIAFDYALQQVPHLIEECFITIESDSFPTHDEWLSHYEDYENQGYDLAGSKLQLSGGEYIHPAGTMYRKSNWIEAKSCAYSYGYNFYDSMVPPCYHLMTRELKDDSALEAKRQRYLPIAESVFHQGMGFNDEDVNTYGRRSMESESPTILPRDGNGQYLRVMYEPGQWFAYWHKAMGKKIKEVPTEIKWLPGRENQNQEYTLMENGFKHLWGITAYTVCDNDPEMKAVVDFKRRQVEELTGGGKK